MNKKTKNYPLEGSAGILVQVPNSVARRIDKEIAVGQLRSRSRAGFIREMLYDVLGLEAPTEFQVLHDIPTRELFAGVDLSGMRSDTQRAVELYRAGSNLTDIQRVFLEEKIPTRRGGTIWYHNSIRNLLIEAMKASGLLDKCKRPSVSSVKADPDSGFMSITRKFVSVEEDATVQPPAVPATKSVEKAVSKAAKKTRARFRTAKKA